MRRELATIPWGLSAVLATALVCRPSHTHTRIAIRVDHDHAELAESLALDVWSEARGTGMPIDVVVDDDGLDALEDGGVSWQVLVPDIDAAAREEAARLRSPMAMRPGDWFADYRDYDAITAHLRDVVALAPDRAALEVIGGSFDGRPIVALHVTGHGTPGVKMLVDGTQHAREWLAAMVTTCVADRLVRDYDRDPRVRDFVDHTDVWVVPVVNPDGYQYSWGNDRYWRKNRHGRYGVDLNRNFSVAWGGRGSSKNERAEDYRGTSPFSEPEAVALRGLAKREHFGLHVDFHTYSQLVLYPWEYTGAPADDRDRFAAVGDRIATAMYAAHETRYALMQGAELYPAAGTMTDWMYGEEHAQSFTIELRPGRGRAGFVVPPDQIRPTCDEGLAAVLAQRAAL